MAVLRERRRSRKIDVTAEEDRGYRPLIVRVVEQQDTKDMRILNEI